MNCCDKSFLCCGDGVPDSCSSTTAPEVVDLTGGDGTGKPKRVKPVAKEATATKWTKDSRFSAWFRFTGSKTADGHRYSKCVYCEDFCDGKEGRPQAADVPFAAGTAKVTGVDDIADHMKTKTWVFHACSMHAPCCSCCSVSLSYLLASAHSFNVHVEVGRWSSERSTAS